MSYFNDLVIRLLELYGYLVLFFGLFLEMLAIPLPGELIMTYAGLTVYEGKLNWLLSIVFAGTGASLGMTIAYLIGYKLGRPFFEKYGSRFHFGPDKLDGISKWFDRYGNKMLIFAYFIPGVRHLTGYFSGTTRLPFRKYAVFAYSGAFFWVSVFITLGKLLGPEWERYHSAISLYMLAFGLLTAVGYLLFTIIRKHRSQIQLNVLAWLEKGLNRFKSTGKVQLLILSAGALFIVCFSFTIGLIQDFLANEFTQFDEVSGYVIARVFTPDWLTWMERMAAFGSYPFLLLPMAATLVWIGFHNKDRLLELTFFAVAMAGGEGLDEALRRGFHRFGPVGSHLSFPSEQVFMAVTVYGFSVYLAVRHRQKTRYRLTATLVVLALLVFIGISSVYMGTNYPSDVAAGYVFGGLWFTLNVALLEIFRLMRSRHLWPRTKLAI